MKKTILVTIILSVVFVGGLVISQSIFAENSCPTNTQVGEREATLVGEVTDDGGDPNLTVWFQYGKTEYYGNETSHQSKYGVGIFCAKVTNLDPCTTYHYRAVAENSAGKSFGEDKTFTTTCLAPVVDIKANGSDGPITLQYQDYVILTWDSENADYCWASGDWSGTKSISGSQTIYLDEVKDYTFELTCKSSSEQTSQDSVIVEVQPLPPTVITKPAIVTY